MEASAAQIPDLEAQLAAKRKEVGSLPSRYLPTEYNLHTALSMVVDD